MSPETGTLALAIAMVMTLAASSRAARTRDALPWIGPALEFSLIAQEGGRLSLADLRGKVLAITLSYTSCADAVYYRTTPRGGVDHTFLTLLVGQTGTQRVQYLGVRFDPDALLHDLQALVQEGLAG